MCLKKNGRKRFRSIWKRTVIVANSLNNKQIMKAYSTTFFRTTHKQHSSYSPAPFLSSHKTPSLHSPFPCIVHSHLPSRRDTIDCTLLWLSTPYLTVTLSPSH